MLLAAGTDYQEDIKDGSADVEEVVRELILRSQQGDQAAMFLSCHRGLAVLAAPHRAMPVRCGNASRDQAALDRRLPTASGENFSTPSLTSALISVPVSC